MFNHRGGYYNNNYSKDNDVNEDVFKEIDKVENTTIVTALLLIAFLTSAFTAKVEGMAWWRAIIEIVGQMGLTSLGCLIIYGIVSVVLLLFRDLFIISSMIDHSIKKDSHSKKRHIPKHVVLCIVVGIASIIIAITRV